MKDNTRQEAIIAYLEQHGTATVHRLSEELYASESTIRRDLTVLEKQGKLRRTFGGAIYAEILNRQVPISLRGVENIEAKHLIAEKAAKEIKDGDTIFLDASTTVIHLVPYLAKHRDLTVVTNGLQTSLLLGREGIVHICTGGTLLTDSMAYVGAQTCDCFRRFNADLVFFSSRGLSSKGQICDSSIEEIQTREAMLSGTGRKIFLCDSSKVGKQYRCNLCSVGAVDKALWEKDESLISIFDQL